MVQMHLLHTFCFTTHLFIWGLRFFFRVQTENKAQVDFYQGQSEELGSYLVRGRLSWRSAAHLLNPFIYTHHNKKLRQQLFSLFVLDVHNQNQRKSDCVVMICCFSLSQQYMRVKQRYLVSGLRVRKKQGT